MFELNQLVCFVTLAEELHFGRAARRLAMTQPPLSRQIQLLEHHLDTKLFDRTSRTVRLTPAGERFLVEARQILRLAEGASSLAKKVALGKTGSIRIGFTAASAYDFVPRLVTACQAELPDVDLSLKEMVSGDQMEALGSGQIDIGFIRPLLVRHGIESMKVFAEGMCLAAPAGIRWRARDRPRCAICTSSPSSCTRRMSPATSMNWLWRNWRRPTSSRAMCSISGRFIPCCHWCGPGLGWRWFRNPRPDFTSIMW